MTFTLKNIYTYYKANGGTLSKDMFKNIICDFNIHIMNHIIYDAGYVDMCNLSRLRVGRIKRTYNGNVRHHSIDWKASNEYKQELLDKGEKLYDDKTKEGTKWLIYNEEDWYCRFYWNRKKAKAKNKSVYSLIVTRGDKGNKDKLKKHLYENEINYLKYKVLNYDK